MATKKTKTVETPIDQRETFVSIQKNFADSDLTVAQKLKTLYEIQQADSEIDKILQLRGDLPGEVESLEAEIAGLKAKVAENTGLIEAFTKSIADNKQNIVDIDTRVVELKEQLAKITNSREFDTINKDIENYGLERMIADKNIVEIKMKIADLKAEIEDIKKGYFSQK